MKSILLRCIFWFAALFISSCSEGDDNPNIDPGPKPTPKILVFYKTAGFTHSSIMPAIVALKKLGSENNIEVDTTRLAANFNKDNLSRYKAVVFLSTTGDVLDNNQQMAFEQFIKAGNGFVGIHAATD